MKKVCWVHLCEIETSDFDFGDIYMCDVCDNEAHVECIVDIFGGLFSQSDPLYCPEHYPKVCNYCGKKGIVECSVEGDETYPNFMCLKCSIRNEGMCKECLHADNYSVASDSTSD